MMDTLLTLELLVKMVERMAETVEEHKDYLSQLDAAIGDGDHGSSMARGFRAVLAKKDELSGKTIGEALQIVGMTLVSVIGGATGPIFGTWFLKAGTVVKDKESLTLHDLAAAFEASLAGIKAMGKAEVGDKTMVDALEPAVNALREAADNGADLHAGLTEAELAARTGADATANMVAKKGRGRYLGDKALGHQDAGANTTYLLIKAMREAI